MKTILSFFIIVAFYSTVFSQNKPDKVNLSGSISSPSNKKLIITNIGSYRAEIDMDAMGQFQGNIKVKPGFYNLNSSYTIYLEPGKDLNFTMSKSGASFSGKGSAENNLIKEIQQLQRHLLHVRNFDLTDSANFIEPSVFLGKISGYKAAVSELINRTSVGTEFKRTLKEISEYDCKNFMNQYKLQYGTDPAKRDSATKYLTAAMKTRKAGEVMNMEVMNTYSKLHQESRIKRLSLEDQGKLEVFENFDLNNSMLYTSSHSYRNLLDNRLKQLLSAESTISPSIRRKNTYEQRIYIVNKAITNIEMRDHLLFQNTLMLLRPGVTLENNYLSSTALIKNPDFLAALKEKYESLKSLASGHLSPSFKFEAANGNLVSSDTFKGSYVYIDLWATWCGPCIAEIPALKELETIYGDKNIRFLSISTDKRADLQKWKMFIVENKLGGTQLIVDKDSEFYKFYNVNTIPRFVLLDPQGKIVDADAKRPSNPALKTQLDELLNN